MPQIAERQNLDYTQNRELSWLKFNERVLEEASDPNVPIMERLRFISIFSSNLDEFFMVRVGSLFDLNTILPKKKDNKSGKTPKEQLDMIFDAVRPLIRMRDLVFRDVSKLLSESGITDVAYNELEDKEKEFVHAYYKNKIRPLISPQIIDRNHPFPHLKNKVLYACALLSSNSRDMLGIVGVPEVIPNIIILPGDKCRFIRTENILFAHIKKIFKIYHIEEKSIISVTRNADISYDDDKFDEDYLDLRNHMARLIRQREKLAPVRLEMQSDAPKLRNMLEHKLKLTPKQTYLSACPLILNYAYQLNNCGESVYNKPYKPVFPDFLRQDVPMYKQIRQRDILLFYPYHSMKPFLNLLKESSVDPRVVSIQMTIYRLAKNSSIVKYLCAAAENGKTVNVLIELRARFDEKNNIEWAQELEEAGCHILYGSDGYKCHSKICLITRQEKSGQLSYITQIGTGNYNEKTACLYTDLSLMTADRTIAEDAVAFFQNMQIDNLNGEYKKLLAAPHSLKQSLIQLIDSEISKGKNGHIILKINSVTERDIIDKLAEASCAGVRTELIVRGICCIVPGIPNLTENITVTSIVGRFLEHSRVYSFGDGEQRKIYISSADIMTRNQTRRVEIACPVESEEIKSWISSYLDILLRDSIKARKLLPNGSYIKKTDEKLPVLSSQEYFMKNPPSFTKTPAPSKGLFYKIKQFFKN